MLWEIVLSRPIEYFMLQDGVLQRPIEYLLQLRKYSRGRQSISAICESILTADKVFSRIDGVLRRPTEFTMLRDGILQRPTEFLLHLRKHSHGRQSIYSRFTVSLRQLLQYHPITSQYPVLSEPMRRMRLRFWRVLIVRAMVGRERRHWLASCS